MYNSDSILQSGDAVYYTGSKYRFELLTKDGKPMKGWIHAAVTNEPGVFVVEFTDLKDGDFIIPAEHLSKARPAKLDKQNYGPEIQPRRSRKGEEDAPKV